MECVNVNTGSVARYLEAQLEHSNTTLQEMQDYGRMVLGKLRFPNTIFQFSIDEESEFDLTHVGERNFSKMVKTATLRRIPRAIYKREYENGVVDSILQELTTKPRFATLWS